MNHYLDEYTPILENILPDDKRINGYMSAIEVEMGMTRRATREATERERQSTDGMPRFLRSCQLIQLTEPVVQVKLARKMIHGKKRFKNNLGGSTAY